MPAFLSKLSSAWESRKSEKGKKVLLIAGGIVIFVVAVVGIRKLGKFFEPPATPLLSEAIAKVFSQFSRACASYYVMNVCSHLVPFMLFSCCCV
jgi:hypothetical protein